MSKDFTHVILFASEILATFGRSLPTAGQ